MYGDPLLLERVLVNLLDNATANTARPAPASACQRGEGDYTALRVRDHGPGLPAGDAARLFEPFSRSERRSAITGVGLGLAICRAIADATRRGWKPPTPRMAARVLPCGCPGATRRFL